MGFSIEKVYLDPKTRKVVKTFERGKQYIVQIKVSTPKKRNFVVIDDQLPAGLEPVNLTFETEKEEDLVETYSWWGGFDHREQYRDRVIFSAHFLREGEHKMDRGEFLSVPSS